MKVIILGCNGLLGQALLRSIPQKAVVLGVARNQLTPDSNFQFIELDILKFDELKKQIEKFQPDYIINAAAYTNVDGCEDSNLSQEVNVKLPEFLSGLNVRLVHISTDFVFDGKSGPYSEDDQINPISEYGRQKYESEKLVLANTDNLIVRTSLVYGYGIGLSLNFHDFVKNSLLEEKTIKIVNDQIGNPTLSNDLADAIWLLLKNNSSGIYNVSGSEILSRLEWALQIADFYGLDNQYIKSCKTSDLNQKAMRPLKSGFKLTKIYKEFKSLSKRDLEHQINSYEKGQS